MTDNYEFSKSCMPQGIEEQSPYVKKDWAYIGDINSGVYANSGLTLVQFDLSSIFNSVSMVDMSQAYITVPLCLVSAYTSSNTGGTVIAPTAGAAPWAAHGLKAGYHNLLHAADLQVNGKTLNQYTPYLNVYTGVKLYSQMSQDDIKSMGPTMGFTDILDNAQSMKFNTQQNMTTSSAAAYPGTTSGTLNLTGGLVGGNGLVNNNPFATNGTLVVVATAQTLASGFAASATSVVLSAAANIVPGMFIQAANYLAANTVVTAVNAAGTTISFSPAVVNANAAVTDVTFYVYASNGGDGSEQGLQNIGAYNNAYYSRLKKYTDVSNGTIQNLYGTSTSVTGAAASNIMTTTFLNNEFKPYSVVLNTNYIVTYDLAVIRCKDILDSLRAFPLAKRVDAQLRLYFNTGSVASYIQPGGYMVTSAGTNNFTNTCPLIQSSLQDIPSTASGIVSGLFIAKATNTNLFGGVNLATSAAAHPLLQCRFYYPMVTLKPEKLRLYQSENLNKKIVYTDILFNQVNTITSGGTFSGILQTGVSNIRGVWIIPFISSSIYGSVPSSIITSGVTSFAQYQSPFDQAPNQNGPLSIINLQVTIGGQNMLMNTLNQTFENFIQQVGLYEKVNAGDLGFSCGLFSQYYWENALRVYYVDCTRGMPGDLMSPRTVLASWGNNTNVTCDYMTFVEFFTEAVIDVETGVVSK